MVIGDAVVQVRADTTKFDRDLRTLGPSANRASKEIGGLGTAGNRAEAALGKLGLTTRDLSVLFGAGLAGGAVLAIRSIVGFGAEVVQVAARLEDAKNLTKRVFQEQADDVFEFAEDAANSIGLSERAALAAVSSFGLFATNLGLPVDAAKDLSLSLTSLASDIASAQPDFVAIEDVLHALERALAGERDPLQRFGVTLTQASVKAQAVKLGIAEVGDELNQTQQIIASYADILEKTNLIQGDFQDTADSLPNQLNTLTANVEELKVVLGEQLLPIVIDSVEQLNLVAEAAQKFNDSLPNIEFGANKAGGATQGFLKRLTGIATGLGAIRTQAQPVLDFLKRYVGGNEEAEDSTEGLTGAEDIAAQSTDALAAAQENNEKATTKAADAYERLDRALGDAERRVDKAETRLNRALEDSERRIDRAEKALAESITERAKDIEEAEEKVNDAREEGAERVRDARRRLADFEIESARRVNDAERKLSDARKRRQTDITDALFALERALAEGDAEAENQARRELQRARETKTIADAERELAQERSDAIRERKEVEFDLAEAIEESAERISDAQEDLAETIERANERIKDSQQALDDARRDGARSIEDAQEGLTDAIRDGNEAVADATKAYERLNEELTKTNKKLQRMKRLQSDILAPGALATGEITEFASGGRSFAGRARIVGEDGPELEIPNYNSTIVSNQDIVAAFKSAVGGISGGATVNIYPQTTDGRVIANEVAYRLGMGINS